MSALVEKSTLRRFSVQQNLRKAQKISKGKLNKYLNETQAILENIIKFSSNYRNSPFPPYPIEFPYLSPNLMSKLFPPHPKKLKLCKKKAFLSIGDFPPTPNDTNPNLKTSEISLNESV
jgi:hypothetical protein